MLRLHQNFYLENDVTYKNMNFKQTSLNAVK